MPKFFFAAGRPLVTDCQILRHYLNFADVAREWKIDAEARARLFDLSSLSRRRRFFFTANTEVEVFKCHAFLLNVELFNNCRVQGLSRTPEPVCLLFTRALGKLSRGAELSTSSTYRRCLGRCANIRDLRQWKSPVLRFRN